jgi:STAS-like domain of unknown function (DUF4325)
VKRIRIKPVPNTTLAENKDEAANLRDETILPALAQGETITLDFSGVETATQSYVHALIADAIRRYGDDSFDLLVRGLHRRRPEHRANSVRVHAPRTGKQSTCFSRVRLSLDPD